MEFRIADTFQDSLAKLTGEEQKVAKTSAFDLQLNPISHGLQMHKITESKDKNFWSVRVSRDIRIIVHKTEASLLLCYIDHHDSAYDWAKRRRIETHPKTGAAQLVEVREMVQEVFVPVQMEMPAAAPARPVPPKQPFAAMTADDLLSYGVPEEWLADVRAATEDTILDIADHLPAEAKESVLALAVGEKPPVSNPIAAGEDPFEHPDAQRRFRVMHNVEELERALDFPWDRWTVFLHPAQRELVERSYNGPARVSGSAGTGKTIVALHRAVFLARSNPDSRVLLTTFSDILANALRVKLRRLVSNEPQLAERIDVDAIGAVAERLYDRHFRKRTVADRAEVRSIIGEASKSVSGHKFSDSFLLSEWEQIVDARQLTRWEEYRDAPRLGRKTRLAEPQRRQLWSIFEQVNATLPTQQLMTTSAMFTRLGARLAGEPLPYDYIVVDEAQDIGVAELRFLATFGAGHPNGLFFAGDLGQRIFQQPFSWKALGVDIRGRSRTLRINYRTSHQIRMQADRLLGPNVSDVDENVEDRRGTVSVFNGAEPHIREFKNQDAESAAVGEWVLERVADGVAPHEVAVFVRSEKEISRAVAALEAAELPYRVLDDRVDTVSGQVSISTMHLAKGLEFRAVAVMACDDDVIPSQERIEAITDGADLTEVYETERHLLYVACTRARDYLLVTSGELRSEFLDDLRQG